MVMSVVAKRRVGDLGALKTSTDVELAAKYVEICMWTPYGQDWVGKCRELLVVAGI